MISNLPSATSVNAYEATSQTATNQGASMWTNVKSKMADVNSFVSTPGDQATANALMVISHWIKSKSCSFDALLYLVLEKKFK